MSGKARSLSFTLALVAILLVAAYLRVHALHQWPPGLSHDEAINGLDALRLWRTGTLPLYRVDGRPEPLYRFLLAPLVGTLGPTRFSLRLLSAFAGILTAAAAARAGRHLAPPGVNPRRTALAAAGVLAVLVGHVTLSRVAYRAILLPFAALMFLDSLLLAWKTGRRTAFVRAGVWLAMCLHTYTAGLVTLGALPLLLIHQALFDRAALRRHARGLTTLLAAFLVTASPLAALVALQPATYRRAGELAPGAETPPLLERLGGYAGEMAQTWASFSGEGDINPQYNVDDAPLLNTLPLYALFLLGIAACIARPRRLSSLLLLGLLLAYMLPVALAGEVPHGLRIAGEYAVVPLLAASGFGLLLWLAARLPRYQPVAALIVPLLFVAALTHAALDTGRRYFTYWERDVLFGGAQVHAFSWFFEGPRTAMAAYAAAQDGPVYLPLVELNHPALRYLTAASHPTVTTFANRLGPDGSLTLPAGTFVLPPMQHLTASYALLEPDGTLTLLPQFDAATLAALEAALAASDDLLADAFDQPTATLVQFPPDGEDIHLDPAIAIPAAANFDAQLTLVGWAGPTQLPSALDPGQRYEFTLYLEAGPRQRRDLDLFAQVWTRDGERIGGLDQPVNRWLYPNSLWQPGDLVPVTFRFPLAEEPRELESGGYRLAVGANDAWGARLPVLDANGAPVADVALAGGLKVPSGDPPPDLSAAQPVHWALGEAITLVGYQLDDDNLQPGDAATLTLTWQATARPLADYTAFFHLEDPAGNVVAQFDVEPTGGLFPTSVWDAGEVYTSLHPVSLPPDAPPGPYALLVGMYAHPGLERLPVRDLDTGDTPPDGRIPLARIP